MENLLNITSFQVVPSSGNSITITLTFTGGEGMVEIFAENYEDLTKQLTASLGQAAITLPINTNNPEEVDGITLSICIREISQIANLDWIYIELDELADNLGYLSYPSYPNK